MLKFLFDFTVTTPPMVMRWLLFKRRMGFMQFLEKDYGPILYDYFFGIIFWVTIGIIFSRV